VFGFKVVAAGSKYYTKNVSPHPLERGGARVGILRVFVVDWRCW